MKRSDFSKRRASTYLFSIDFNESIMCRTPEEFVDDILIRKFRMRSGEGLRI